MMCDVWNMWVFRNVSFQEVLDSSTWEFRNLSFLGILNSSRWVFRNLAFQEVLNSAFGGSPTCRSRKF